MPGGLSQLGDEGLKDVGQPGPLSAGVAIAAHEFNRASAVARAAYESNSGVRSTHICGQEEFIAEG